ncbi:hypothetical protein I9W82_000323 [Candida metapsilosis]|uniref:Ketopantoate reductase C-terminal domain-containing protein n=1 Tax=Candida metapsilosis TaxID=273372 RepID=A0A8H7ZKF6_9ASCO|nr:hypothetical protein I9W82_000323 [Candida metapsilosis]
MPEFSLLTDVLIVGSNPNVSFYAWRLYQVQSVELTIVDLQFEKTRPINWKSTSLGASQYSPHEAYSTIQELPTHKRYDVVILSCNSLQDFQATCSGLNKFIHDKTIILVESTGYINLEPFVTASFPKSAAASLLVMSIMNESDVRKTSRNTLVHQVRNRDARIYFGTSSGASSKLTSHPSYQKMYNLLQYVQENSNGAITLLKSSNPKEFMTYQWKLALPRIVFDPVMILFEIEYPELLKSQILSKPLITGLINELFKLIKKMDCKLVKGFENEANLLESWSNFFPAVKSNDHFVNSPRLFYNFYHKLDLELDLLLLQPILLGDDNGIRTPYLENLYSIMCQFNKINHKSSIFFKRKLGDEPDSERLITAKQLEDDIATKTQKHRDLEKSIKDYEVSKISIDNDVRKQQQVLKSLEQQIINTETKLSNLSYEFEKRSRTLEMEHEAKFKSLNQQYNERLRDLEANFAKQKIGPNNSPPLSIPMQQPTPSQDDQMKPNGYRESVMSSDGLADFKHIIQYNDVVPNGTTDTPKLEPPMQPSQGQSSENFVDAGTGTSDLPPHILQKELELKSREEALRAREGSIAGYQQQQQQQQRTGPSQYPGYQPNGYAPQQQQQQHHNHHPSSYNNQPGFFNGPQNGYSDQQPPHGLPSGGLPPNQFPPNLKTNGSMVNMNGFPPQQQPMPAQYSGYNQQRRLNSMPGINNYQEFQQHQQQFGNSASFNNAAPIDPFIEQRFKTAKRNNNRRSQMPMMGNIDGLDMGGRGGMPLPGARKSMVHQFNSSALPPQQARRSTSNPLLNGGQSQSQQHLQPPMQQSHSQDLHPPNMHSSSSSANSNDTPKTGGDHENNVKLQVPVVVDYNQNAKPLGGIAESNKEGGDKKKKKKGLFHKKS